jgi:hypothetical protein
METWSLKDQNIQMSKRRFEWDVFEQEEEEARENLELEVQD